MKNFINNMICRLKEDIKYVENYIKVLEENAEEYKLFGNSEQVKCGWIPCSERLPKEDGRYLVTWKEDWGNGRYEYFVFKAEYARGEWSIQEKDERYSSSVIAWQPLPTPYNQRGE